MILAQVLQWIESLVVPIVVAIIVGAPSYMTARKVLRENRDQHGDNGEKLEAVQAEVAQVRRDVGGLSDKVDRFIYRTEAWRDHLEEEVLP